METTGIVGDVLRDFAERWESAIMPLYSRFYFSRCSYGFREKKAFFQKFVFFSCFFGGDSARVSGLRRHVPEIISRAGFGGDLNLVEYGDGAFFFTRVKVGIGVPGHGDIAVAETAGDLLDIDALVGEERSV